MNSKPIQPLKRCLAANAILEIFVCIPTILLDKPCTSQSMGRSIIKHDPHNINLGFQNVIMSVVANLDCQTPFKTQIMENSHRSLCGRIFITTRYSRKASGMGNIKNVCIY